MPGCQEDEGDRGGFLKTQIIRNRQNILRRNSYKLCIPSLSFIANNLVRFAETIPARRAVFASSITDSRRNQNLVARLVILDQTSNSSHFTRNVATRNVRHRNSFTSCSLPRPDVEVV